MKRFPYAHATHPQWRMAVALVLAQLRAQMALPDHAPALGLLYITDHYASEADALLAHLSAELPEVSDWVGTVGVGVAVTNAEYFDEPALAVMLCDLSPAQYRVFSGILPLNRAAQPGEAPGFVAHTALLHADGNTPDVAELILELAERTDSAYVFGGLAASRSQAVQFARSRALDGRALDPRSASGILQGGLSGVAFDASVGLVSRVTQGAQPLGREHTVTASDSNLVLELDGQPALDVLLQTLAISLDQPAHAMPRLRATLVGLNRPDGYAASQTPTNPVAPPRRGQFGPEVMVRHLIGLDLARRGVALADLAPVGTRLAFCERNMPAARADLVRACTEIREALEPETLSPSPVAVPGSDPGPQSLGGQRMLGAIYVSCAGRGGPHFGGPSAELHIVRRALGDVPLVGFFAGGEIAHHQLYGYSGVLTVFTAPD